ncbi:MAG: guanylate kinase, partial [Burkholderiaceae bacterium]
MSAPHSPQQSIGNLYVVAAPSGAGKSSLVKALMELDARVTPSVSHTTRAPRGQEMDGREYFFVDDATFDAMTAREEFLEWAHVHGHRYGTSRLVINERIASGMDVVL